MGFFGIAHTRFRSLQMTLQQAAAGIESIDIAMLRG